MIAAYNRKQLLLAILSGLGSLICYGFAFGFFIGAVLITVAATGIPQLSEWAPWVAAGVLLLITISGYRTWRNRGGYYRYDQSGMYHRTDAFHRAGIDPHQVTGWAYLLGQLFLSGPLLALRAVSHVHNRIPTDPGLESLGLSARATATSRQVAGRGGVSGRAN